MSDKTSTELLISRPSAALNSMTCHSVNMPPINSEKMLKIYSLLSEQPSLVESAKLFFVGGRRFDAHTAGSGIMGFLQDFFKKRPSLYRAIVDTISPVVTTRRFRALLSGLLADYDVSSVIVNYGSGPFVLNNRSDIINVDLFPFPAVDIVCDSFLPFQPCSVDCFVSLAVLEHMRDPGAAITEMYRCLKPGGEVLVYVPFIQPLHAAPHDYQRYTQAGLKELFKRFEIVNVDVGSGSTSGFLWVFQHWLSGILSLGCRPLKEVLFLALMLITFPIKYLDLLFESLDSGGDISSAYYIYCRKPYPVVSPGSPQHSGTSLLL